MAISSASHRLLRAIQTARPHRDQVRDSSQTQDSSLASTFSPVSILLFNMHPPDFPFSRYKFGINKIFNIASASSFSAFLYIIIIPTTCDDSPSFPSAFLYSHQSPRLSRIPAAYPKKFIIRYTISLLRACESRSTVQSAASTPSILSPSLSVWNTHTNVGRRALHLEWGSVLFPEFP